MTYGLGFSIIEVDMSYDLDLLITEIISKIYGHFYLELDSYSNQILLL